MQSKSLINSATIALIALMVLAFFSMNPEVFSKLLYILLPVSTILSLIGLSSTRLNRYMKIVTILFAWIFFCSIFSVDFYWSVVQLKRLICVYMTCLVVYYVAQYEQLMPYLCSIWLVLFGTALLYARTHILTLGYDYSSDRITDDVLNANLLAYYTFFASSIVFLLRDEVANKLLKRVLSIAFFALFPLSFYMAIITASRQVLVVQIPLLLLFTYVRYYMGSRRSLLFLFVSTIVCIGVYVLSDSIVEIFNNSLLSKRMDYVTEDGRITLIRQAWEVGWQHPLVGVGPNCFQIVTGDAFAHNTYLELFADTGLFGMCIYIYMLFVFLKEQYRRYKSTKDKQFLVILFIGLIYAIANNFYVYYLTSWLLSFFVLISCYSQYYFDRKYKIPNSYEYETN